LVARLKRAMTAKVGMTCAMVDTTLRLDGRDLIAHTYQDAEDIVERNKALRTLPQKSDWGRHVASIPLNIINQWLNEEWARGNVDLRMGGEEFDAMVTRKLSDPDWRFLRTDR
jgi:hypothetical protein